MTNKNILIIISLLILISLGVILGLRLNLKQRPQPTPIQPQLPPISQPTQAPQQKSESIDTSNWKTYRNEKYGFEVRYPAEKVQLKVRNKSEEYFDFTTFKVIEIDTTLDQKSNLPTGIPKGRIEIYANNEPIWLKNCLVSQTTSKTIPDEIKEINGTKFYVFDESSFAIGGKRGNEKSYRVIHNNTCYRIQSFVLWESIEFYHQATDGLAPTKEEIEEERLIQNQLNFNQQMLSTFRFFGVNFIDIYL